MTDTCQSIHLSIFLGKIRELLKENRENERNINLYFAQKHNMKKNNLNITAGYARGLYHARFKTVEEWYRYIEKRVVAMSLNGSTNFNIFVANRQHKDQIRKTLIKKGFRVSLYPRSSSIPNPLGIGW